MLSDGRLASLRERMTVEGIVAFVVTAPANMAYVTGFEGVLDDDPGTVCVVSRESAVVFTDRRYGEAAEAAATGTGWAVDVGAGPLLVRVCDHVAAGRVAVESSLPYASFRQLSGSLGDRLVVTDLWLEEARQVKDAGEIGRIEAAAALADATMARVPGMLAVGRSEREVALDVEVSLRRDGSEGVAFAPIVAAGPDSARPHAVPGGRLLEQGDLVVVDLGARSGGYCSDLTRTFCIGPATDRQREVHAAVLAANAAGVAAVRAGVTGRDADAAAREVLNCAGLGEAFGHGLGHGVGLEVHELPGVGRTSAEPLPVGSVVTVEPGAYLTGWGGVRIEDLVVVGEDGCTVLSDADRSLIEIA